MPRVVSGQRRLRDVETNVDALDGDEYRLAILAILEASRGQCGAADAATDGSDSAGMANVEAGARHLRQRRITPGRGDGRLGLVALGLLGGDGALLRDVRD